jgi:O-Antigen ligase
MLLDFSTRWTWWFLSPNHLGAWSVALLLLLLGVVLYFPAAKSWRGILWWVLMLSGIILFTLTCAWSASRAAWVALAFGLMVLLIKNHQARALCLSAGIIALLLIATFAVDRSRARALTVTQFGQDASSQSRLISWNSALRMAGEHPWFGVGVGNFSDYYSYGYEPKERNNKLMTANNDILHVHAEGGMGFGVLLLWLHLIIAALLVAALRKNHWPIIITGTATSSFFISGLFNNVITFHTLWPWVIGLSALTAGLSIRAWSWPRCATLACWMIIPAVFISGLCVGAGAYLQRHETSALIRSGEQPWMMPQHQSPRGHVIIGAESDDMPRMVYRGLLTALANAGWSAEVHFGPEAFFTRLNNSSEKTAQNTYALTVRSVTQASMEKYFHQPSTLKLRGWILIDPISAIAPEQLSYPCPLLIMSGEKLPTEQKQYATDMVTFAQRTHPTSTLKINPWATTWTRLTTRKVPDMSAWMENVEKIK